MKAILIFIMILALSGCGKDDSSQDRESATDPIIYEQPELNEDVIEPEETEEITQVDEITEPQQEEEVDEITEPQQEEEVDEITEPQQEEEPDEEIEENDTAPTPFIWGQSKWGEGNWK